MGWNSIFTVIEITQLLWRVQQKKQFNGKDCDFLCHFTKMDPELIHQLAPNRPTVRGSATLFNWDCCKARKRVFATCIWIQLLSFILPQIYLHHPIESVVVQVLDQHWRKATRSYWSKVGMIPAVGIQGGLSQLEDFVYCWLQLFITTVTWSDGTSVRYNITL